MVRQRALDEGESVLRAGAVGHNHLWFYHFAIFRLAARQIRFFNPARNEKSCLRIGRSKVTAGSARGLSPAWESTGKSPGTA